MMAASVGISLGEKSFCLGQPFLVQYGHFALFCTLLCILIMRYFCKQTLNQIYYNNYPENRKNLYYRIKSKCSASPFQGILWLGRILLFHQHPKYISSALFLLTWPYICLNIERITVSMFIMRYP